MKLSKDYFTDAKNAKHIPAGNLRTKIEQITRKHFGESLSSGNLFVIDNELDGRWFLKFEKQVTDWSKDDSNLWLSSFTKSIKFYNVLDRTTYLIYKKT